MNSTKSNFDANRNAFTKLEVSDRLSCSCDNRMLSSNGSHFVDCFFNVLFVAAGFAKTHVEDDLDDLRTFHDGGIAKFLHENDFFIVSSLKTGDIFGLLIALRMRFLCGYTVFLFFSHFSSPYLMISPLFLAMRTFLPSANL